MARGNTSSHGNTITSESVDKIITDGIVDGSVNVDNIDALTDALNPDESTTTEPASTTEPDTAVFTPGPTQTRKAALVAAIRTAVDADAVPFDPAHALGIGTTAQALGSSASATVDQTFAALIDPLIPNVADPEVMAQLQRYAVLKGAVSDLVSALKKGPVAAPVDPLLTNAKALAVSLVRAELDRRNVWEVIESAKLDGALVMAKANDLLGEVINGTTLELADFIASNTAKAKRAGSGNTGVRVASGFDLARVPNGTAVTYTHKGTVVGTATVTDGMLVLSDGRSFKSVSGAAEALNGGTATRGTMAWKDAKGTAILDLMV